MALRAELAAYLGDAPGLTPDTRRLAWQVFDLMHGRTLLPALAPGFDCSVRFVWPWLHPPQEFEVCDGLIEIHRFLEHADRVTMVPCLSGDALPDEITEALPFLGSPPPH